MSKKTKNIPSSQTVWVKAASGSGDIFYITSSHDRQTYFLYKEEPDGFSLLDKDKSPVSFNDVIYPPEEVKVKRRRVKG